VMSEVVKEYIKKIVDRKESLNGEEVSQCIRAFMNGEASEGQIGAFLIAMKSVALEPEVLHGCATAMVEAALPCDISRPGDRVDIVGTGGDGMDTYNISTAAGFVVAAAGLTVVKHGNVSASGSVGSANFIEALGANIRLDNVQVAKVVDDCGFAFLFAQVFHPAMRHVAPVRKLIGVRTVFNLLGPLSNPISVDYQVTGVASMELGPLFAEVLLRQGKKRALVVHSEEGMNEISPIGKTHAWLVNQGAVCKIVLEPSMYNLEPVPVAAEGILGGSVEERAALLHRVFAGEKCPLRSFLVVNAATVLWVAEAAADLCAAAAIVEEILDSGKAAAKLKEYAAATQALSV